MNIWQRFIGKNRKNCKEVAKKRLQLVLVQDRLSLSQKELTAMKNDLLTVIAGYIPIDPRTTQVDFRRKGQEMALIANIPLNAVERDIGKDITGKGRA